MNNVGQTNPSTWDSLRRILANPSVGAGLIQAGLQAMQPIAVGQSRLGHLANAAGEGFEVGGRIAARDAEDEKQAREQQRIDQQARYQDEQVNLERERNQLTREENKSQDWARRQSNDPNRVSLDRMFGAKATFLGKAATDEFGNIDPDKMQQASDMFDSMFGNGGKKPASAASSSPETIPDPAAVVNESAAAPETKPQSMGGMFPEPITPFSLGLNKMFQPQGDAAKLTKQGPVAAKPNPTQGRKVATTIADLDRLGIAVGEEFIVGSGPNKGEIRTRAK
jgi:hypothetical protein